MKNQGKRYHPTWMLFEVISFFKNTFFIIIFLYILRAGTNTGWILWAKYLFVVVTLGSFVYIILKWITSTYEIKNNSIMIREGVFHKNHRSIPIERIQNHQTTTNFLHRIFGLTSITLETGTSEDDASVKFPVITQQESQQIRDVIQNVELKDEIKVDLSIVKTVHFRSTKKDNIKAAFTSLSFLAIFPIVLTIYSQIDEFYNLDESAKGVFHYFKEHLWLLLPLVIVVMLVSLLIGFIQTMIKYGNYEIASDDERIYISKGVLTLSSFSIQKNRVQAIEIKQSLIKRLLGMAEVKIVSAGQTGDEEDESNSLYPFMAKHKAYELINTLLPNYHIEDNFHRLPKKVLILRLIRPYYGTFIIGILLAIFAIEWIGVVALVFLIAILSRSLNFFFTGYMRKGEFIQIRKGGFISETFITRRDRIQEIVVSHSFLQRKFNVATIRFFNRSKPVQESEIMDLSKDEVSEFYYWFKRRG